MSYFLVIVLLLEPEWVEFRVPVNSLAACHVYLTKRLRAPESFKDSVYLWCDRNSPSHGEEGR